MENASKALLIAAAVLIVILLIAFGMRIFNSTGDTSEQAEMVGNQITTATDDATLALMLSMPEQLDKNTFWEYLKKRYEGNNRSAQEVKSLWDTLEKYNPSHDHAKPHISCGIGNIIDNGKKIEEYNLSNSKTYKIQFPSKYVIYIYINN